MIPARARRSFVLLLPLPALLAVGGAGAGSGWATAIGGIAVLAGLAALIPPAVPRSARLLLCGGLALLAVVIVVRAAWTYDGGDPFAFVVDPDRERSRFRWESAEAAAVVLACAVLALALLRARRGRWRRDVAGVAGLALLAWSAWSAAGVARSDRPVTRHLDAFLQPGTEVSVAVEPGPAFETRAAVAVAVLLLGAALTALSVASLSRAAP